MPDLTVVSRKIEENQTDWKGMIPLRLKQMRNNSLNPKTTSRTALAFSKCRALIGWLPCNLAF